MTFDEWLEGQTNERLDELWRSKTGLAKAAWDHQQAAIDRLMLELCPDEMTPEQVQAWEASQKPIESDGQFVMTLMGHGHPCLSVSVFKLPDEYVCCLYKDGTHYEPADYFTDDLADALATAQQMVKQ